MIMYFISSCLNTAALLAEATLPPEAVDTSAWYYSSITIGALVVPLLLGILLLIRYFRSKKK